MVECIQDKNAYGLAGGSAQTFDVVPWSSTLDRIMMGSSEPQYGCHSLRFSGA